MVAAAVATGVAEAGDEQFYRNEPTRQRILLHINLFPKIISVLFHYALDPNVQDERFHAFYFFDYGDVLFVSIKTPLFEVVPALILQHVHFGVEKFVLAFDILGVFDLLVLYNRPIQ